MINTILNRTNWMLTFSISVLNFRIQYNAIKGRGGGVGTGIEMYRPMGQERQAKNKCLHKQPKNF